MKKRFLATALCAVLMLGAVPAGAVPSTGTAYPRTQTVLLNGKAVELSSYALVSEQGETNYVRLTDIASLLNGTDAQFEVGWDGQVQLLRDQAYTPDGSEFTSPFSGAEPYQVPDYVTNVDGEAVDIPAIVLHDQNGGGYTYYQLVALGAAVDCTVKWVPGVGITMETAQEPVEVADGEFDLEAFGSLYFTPPARKTTFDVLTVPVEEKPMDNQARELLAQNPELTMSKKMVGEVPMYECYRDDGTEKPVVFLLHGGGGSKENNFENLITLANMGIYAVALDAAGSGESDRGPLATPIALAETVKYIDTLMEYCATAEQADATNAAIVGGSLGGNIPYCYVAYGEYPLTAIFPCLGTPDLTTMDESALVDAFDHGKNKQPCPWTKEQVMAFLERYNPILYPERFLETYIYAGNGALDTGIGFGGAQELEQALIQLGGSNFEFYVDPDRGHERLPEYYDNLFQRIEEIMLG